MLIMCHQPDQFTSRSGASCEIRSLDSRKRIIPHSSAQVTLYCAFWAVLARNDGTSKVSCRYGPNPGPTTSTIRETKGWEFPKPRTRRAGRKAAMYLGDTAPTGDAAPRFRSNVSDPLTSEASDIEASQEYKTMALRWYPPSSNNSHHHHRKCLRLLASPRPVPMIPPSPTHRLRRSRPISSQLSRLT